MSTPAIGRIVPCSGQATPAISRRSNRFRDSLIVEINRVWRTRRASTGFARNLSWPIVQRRALWEIHFSKSRLSNAPLKEGTWTEINFAFHSYRGKLSSMRLTKWKMFLIARPDLEFSFHRQRRYRNFARMEVGMSLLRVRFCMKVCTCLWFFELFPSTLVENGWHFTVFWEDSFISFFLGLWVWTEIIVVKICQLNWKIWEMDFFV